MSESRTIIKSEVILQKVLSILVWVFTLFIALQVLLAGLAMFMNSSYWSYHAGIPRLFFLLPLVMAIIAYTSRLPRMILWRCVGLMGMMILMFFTAAISSRVPLFGAAHPVIALLLFWSGLNLIQKIKVHGGKTIDQ